MNHKQFVRHSARALVVVLVALTMTACRSDGNGDAAAKTTKPTVPSLRITSPATGTTVSGNVVRLALGVPGVTLVKADGDTSGATGHVHVFIDKEPPAVGAAIPKEAGIVHSTDNPVVLSGLSVGSHRLAVVLGDGLHQRLPGPVQRTTVTVAGPSVDASAPASLSAGQVLTITMKTEGIQIVPANGDVSGTTGHFHVFVDRAPTAAGQVIPKEAGIIHAATPTVDVPGLAAGEHTLWVVVGDGNHMPLEPSVMDKLVVVVT